MTTFDTGRVQIGIRHFRPMPTIYGDMLAIQKALLEKRTAQPQSLLARIAGAAWGWL